MKFYKQRTKDDCMRCCLATLLDIPYEEVPNFHPEDPALFDKLIRDFLSDRGLALLNVGYTEDIGSYLHGYDQFIHMICGPTTRDTDMFHACLGYSGKFLHDPHKSNLGLDRFRRDEWFNSFLVKI